MVCTNALILWIGIDDAFFLLILESVGGGGGLEGDGAVVGAGTRHEGVGALKIQMSRT